MTRAKHQPSKSTSEPIQFRWNWRDEMGRQALEALARFKEHANYVSLPHLFATALLRLDGKQLKPRSTMAEIAAKVDRLQESVEHNHAQVLEALAGMDLSAYRHSDTGRSVLEDLGDTLSTEVYDQMFSGVQGKEFDVD